jgi:cell fate regulator YaaT (PSP1 superfamily)
MTKTVGVHFKSGGKIYDFDAGAFVLRLGEAVIVETERGLAMGTVAREAVTAETAETTSGTPEKALKKVYRPASAEDELQLCQNADLERRAHRLCQQLVKELGLEMNLFAVESTFDAAKLTFFFTSEGRVDFRQLVKRLVRELGIRVEMRQVGIRNQAKMCGGLGRCGRELCCSAFIDKFGPVSIRMAKDQGLSLNPTKISGQCGRLMCCLTYEHETYLDLRKDFPKIGKTVMTKEGRGKVVRHNPLGQRVAVRIEAGPEIEVDLGDITDV